MKFFADFEIKDRFRKEGHVLLPGLVAQETCAEWKLEARPMQRDLWRDMPAVKSLVLSRRLSELVDQFVLERPIRLAFDHWIPAASIEAPLFTHDLQTSSSVQPLVGLFLICVHTQTEQEGWHVGDALFFGPKTAPEIFQQLPVSWASFLVVAYAKAQCRYVEAVHDPALYALKRLNYNFGDPLTDATHPVLLR